MRKILYIFLFYMFLWLFWVSQAEDEDIIMMDAYYVNPILEEQCKSNNYKCYYVTTKIPGSTCKLISREEDDPTTRKYLCSVGTGFEWFKNLLKGLVGYFTFFCYIAGVFMLVASGIQLQISGLSSENKEAAKKRIIQVITGLVILGMIQLILTTIAPWVYN